MAHFEASVPSELKFGSEMIFFIIIGRVQRFILLLFGILKLLLLAHFVWFWVLGKLDNLNGFHAQ